jgi:hypothetical protein
LPGSLFSLPPYQPPFAPPPPLPVAGGVGVGINGGPTARNSSSSNVKGGGPSYLNPSVNSRPQPPPLVTPQRVVEHQNLMATTSKVQALLASLPPSQRQQYIAKMKKVTTSTIPPPGLNGNNNSSSSSFLPGGGVLAGSGPNPNPYRGMPPPLANIPGFPTTLQDSFSPPFSPRGFLSPRGMLSPRGVLDVGPPGGFTPGGEGGAAPMGQYYPPLGGSNAPNLAPPRGGFSNAPPPGVIHAPGPLPPPHSVDPFQQGGPIMGLKPRGIARSQPGFMAVASPRGMRGTFSEGGNYPPMLVPLPPLQQQQQHQPQRGGMMEVPRVHSGIGGGGVQNDPLADAQFEAAKMNVMRLQKQRDHLKAMVGQIQQQQQQGMVGGGGNPMGQTLPYGQRFGPPTGGGFNNGPQQPSLYGDGQQIFQQQQGEQQLEQAWHRQQQGGEGSWVHGAGDFPGPFNVIQGDNGNRLHGPDVIMGMQGSGGVNEALFSPQKGSGVSLLHDAWRSEDGDLMLPGFGPDSWAGPVDSNPYSNSSFAPQNQRGHREGKEENQGGVAVAVAVAAGAVAASASATASDGGGLHTATAGAAAVADGVSDATATLVVDATAREVAAVVHELVESAVMASCSSNDECCAGDEEATAGTGAGDASATAGVAEGGQGKGAGFGSTTLAIEGEQGHGCSRVLDLPDIPLPQGLDEVREGGGTS